VAAILLIAHRTGDGHAVLHAASLIAFVAVIEVSVMGRMRHKSLPIILCFPLLCVWLLEGIGLRSRERALELGLEPTSYALQLALEYAWAACLAVLVHSLARLMDPRKAARQVLLLSLSLPMALLFSWLDQQETGPRASLLPLLVVACVAAFLATPAMPTAATRRDLGVSVGLALWMLVPLPALALVWQQFGSKGLVALILLSKVGDAAGYYAGHAFGRSHPFPKLSPAKTTEGCIASLGAAICLGALLVVAGVLPARPLGVVGGLVAGAAVNLAAQAGDLLESWVKRRAGVKDSSSWLGPAGGLLDLLDSLLLSVPVALVCWPPLFA
jgi:CDP-diglyceride synthetase